MSERNAPPLVIVQVPIDDDPLFPSHVMFYREGNWTHDLHQATQFEDAKAAQKKANQVIHYGGGNVFAEPVSFPIAWALHRAVYGPWNKRKVAAPA